VTATRRSATKRRLENQGGNTLIEFAMSFTLLFLILAGVFQFGYGFYAYNVLVNSVRDAARYASNYPYSSTTTTPDATYLANVQNMAVYGTPTPVSGAAPLVAKLSTNNVSVVMTAGNTGGLTPPTRVTVSIVNFTLDAAITTFSLNGRPNCSFPYTGILTPP
jgi:Flp pilus assembly protein TadG